MSFAQLLAFPEVRVAVDEHRLSKVQLTRIWRSSSGAKERVDFEVRALREQGLLLGLWHRGEAECVS